MILRSLFLCFLINSVISQTDVDQVIDDVLGEPKIPNKRNVTSVPAEIITTIKPEIPNDSEECTCVPYYLCANGTIVTDGTGLIDIKIKGVCEDFIETCCKEPLKTPIRPKPTERKGCGQRRPEGTGFRIIGDDNNEAQFGEFPWMVAILNRSVLKDGTEKTDYRCGGALIHENVVLTAAHCITKGNNQNKSELHIRAGEWDTQRTSEIFPPQNRKVVQTITHPGFQIGNLWNDFALLVLESPVTLGENIDTVCLPTSGVVPLSTECFATGWGKTEFGAKGRYQTILKKIDLPIVTKNQCVDLLRKTRLTKYYMLHDSFVCAGGVIGKDTCTGDGGSPLVCPIKGKPGTYEVTGLVSWGIGCGSETPGVYAGVAYARNWIDKTMGELGYTIGAIDPRS